MTALQNLINDLDDEERASLSEYTDRVQAVADKLVILEKEPMYTPEGKINPAARLYREYFTMYTRAMLLLQNHVRSVKRARKLDALKYGEGSQLSPLERWLETLEMDDGND